MKAIIRNDLYSLQSATKTFFLMIVILGGINLYNGNFGFVIPFTGVLCSTAIANTFALDDSVKWARYAMVMPMKRSAYPLAKFITLLILTSGGIGGSSVVTFLAVALRNGLTADIVAELAELLIVACISLLLFYMVGSLMIVLLLKYGVERARLLIFAAILVPVGFVYGGYKLLETLGVVFTEELIRRLVLFIPVLALIVIAVCLLLSIRIFEKKEL